MWVNHHRTWDSVEKVNNKLVWCSVLLLFFSSFFPYTTSLVSSHFNNPVAQALYGIVVLLVTASNVWMYHELQKVDESYIQGDHFNILNPAGIADIVIKLIGLALTLTIWPAAMMWAVLFTAIVIVIPRAI